VAADEFKFDLLQQLWYLVEYLLTQKQVNNILLFGMDCMECGNKEGQVMGIRLTVEFG
jgi:hypothetical protein